MIFTQRTGEEAEGSGVHELTADSGPTGSNTSAKAKTQKRSLRFLRREYSRASLSSCGFPS